MPSASVAPGWLVSIRMVRPALVPGEMLSGLQQLPPNAPALELRQDVEGEFGEVQVVREWQRNVPVPTISPSTLATRMTWRS